MKTYLRIHIVKAEPMTRGEHLKSKDLAFIPAPGTSLDDPGYLVVYPDGYRSWCPKDSFERAGFPLERDDKITPPDIGEFISRGTETIDKIGEKTTLVSRRYATGIEDFETSSCVDPANYDPAVGGACAAERLDDRIWMFLGWALAWGLNGVNSKHVEPPTEPPAEPPAEPQAFTPPDAV